MSNNDEAYNHLNDLKKSINEALSTIIDYGRIGSKMTAENRAAELLKVTTIPVTRLHADNCAICSTWDGSVAP